MTGPAGRCGQVISLGSPHYGLRTYLAVRGGIHVEPVLGSRSSDVMSGIGPQSLQPGDVLPVGEHTKDFPELDQAPVASFTEDPIELNVVPGPRDDWFVDPDALVHSEWVASDRSDRVGMWLDGRPLQHRWPDLQLPSEGGVHLGVGHGRMVRRSGHPDPDPRRAAGDAGAGKGDRAHACR